MLVRLRRLCVFLRLQDINPQNCPIYFARVRRFYLEQYILNLGHSLHPKLQETCSSLPPFGILFSGCPSRDSLDPESALPKKVGGGTSEP
jgi:hypothetical protein